tara:strand:- start:28 stop:201 length:174 start_codon:yes stop_codon:yes gene_type:complete
MLLGNNTMLNTQAIVINIFKTFIFGVLIKINYMESNGFLSRTQKTQPDGWVFRGIGA